MPKRITFEGQTHVFPDDFTDEDISLALESAPPAPSAQQLQNRQDISARADETAKEVNSRDDVQTVNLGFMDRLDLQRKKILRGEEGAPSAIGLGLEAQAGAGKEALGFIESINYAANSLPGIAARTVTRAVGATPGPFKSEREAGSKIIEDALDEIRQYRAEQHRARGEFFSEPTVVDAENYIREKVGAKPISPALNELTAKAGGIAAIAAPSVATGGAAGLVSLGGAMAAGYVGTEAFGAAGEALAPVIGEDPEHLKEVFGTLGGTAAMVAGGALTHKGTAKVKKWSAERKAYNELGNETLDPAIEADLSKQVRPLPTGKRFAATIGGRVAGHALGAFAGDALFMMWFLGNEGRRIALKTAKSSWNNKEMRRLRREYKAETGREVQIDPNMSTTGGSTPGPATTTEVSTAPRIELTEGTIRQGTQADLVPETPLRQPSSSTQPGNVPYIEPPRGSIRQGSTSELPTAKPTSAFPEAEILSVQKAFGVNRTKALELLEREAAGSAPPETTVPGIPVSERTVIDSIPPAKKPVVETPTVEAPPVKATASKKPGKKMPSGRGASKSKDLVEAEKNLTAAKKKLAKANKDNDGPARAKAENLVEKRKAELKQFKQDAVKTDGIERKSGTVRTRGGRKNPSRERKIGKKDARSEEIAEGQDIGDGVKTGDVYEMDGIGTVKVEAHIGRDGKIKAHFVNEKGDWVAGDPTNANGFLKGLRIELNDNTISRGSKKPSTKKTILDKRIKDAKADSKKNKVEPAKNQAEVDAAAEASIPVAKAEAALDRAKREGFGIKDAEDALANAKGEGERGTPVKTEPSGRRIEVLSGKNKGKTGTVESERSGGKSDKVDLGKKPSTLNIKLDDGSSITINSRGVKAAKKPVQEKAPSTKREQTPKVDKAEVVYEVKPTKDGKRVVVYRDGKKTQSFDKVKGPKGAEEYIERQMANDAGGAVSKPTGGPRIAQEAPKKTKRNKEGHEVPQEADTVPVKVEGAKRASLPIRPQETKLTRKTTGSKGVPSYAYDGAGRVLELQHADGRIYRYYGVEKAAVDAALAAESKGKGFGELERGHRKAGGKITREPDFVADAPKTEPPKPTETAPKKPAKKKTAPAKPSATKEDLVAKRNAELKAAEERAARDKKKGAEDAKRESKKAGPAKTAKATKGHTIEDGKVVSHEAPGLSGKAGKALTETRVLGPEMLENMIADAGLLAEGSLVTGSIRSKFTLPLSVKTVKQTRAYVEQNFGKSVPKATTKPAKSKFEADKVESARRAKAEADRLKKISDKKKKAEEKKPTAKPAKKKTPTKATEKPTEKAQKSTGADNEYTITELPNGRFSVRTAKSGMQVDTFPSAEAASSHVKKTMNGKVVEVYGDAQLDIPKPLVARSRAQLAKDKANRIETEANKLTVKDIEDLNPGFKGKVKFYAGKDGGLTFKYEDGRVIFQNNGNIKFSAKAGEAWNIKNQAELDASGRSIGGRTSYTMNRGALIEIRKKSSLPHEFYHFMEKLFLTGKEILRARKASIKRAKANNIAVSEQVANDFRTFKNATDARRAKLMKTLQGRVFQKIIDFTEAALDKVYTTQKGVFRQAMKAETLQRVGEGAKGAAKTAVEAFENAGRFTPNKQMINARPPLPQYSIETYFGGEVQGKTMKSGREAFIKQAKRTKMSQKQIDKALKDADLAAHIDNMKPLLRPDLSVQSPSGTNISSLRSNRDFVKSWDLDAECIRAEPFHALVDSIQRKSDKILTRNDRLSLTALQRNEGGQPQCSYCYKGGGLNVRADFMRKATSEGFNLNRTKINHATGKNEVYRVDKYDPVPPEWFIKPEAEVIGGLTPKELKRFKAAKQYLGGAGANLVKPMTPYKGEFLKMKPSDVSVANSRWGIRINSSTDMKPYHALDLIQGINDASVTKLSMHAYAKEPNFILGFGDTGIKINMSMFGRSNGKGGITFDSVEGIDPKFVMWARERYPDTGGMLLGTDAGSIIAGMRPENAKLIGQIIPHHASGQPKIMMERLKRENYLDASERSLLASEVAPGRTLPKKQSKGHTYIERNLHKDKVETFLRIAEERQLRPRHAQFIYELDKNGRIQRGANGKPIRRWTGKVGAKNTAAVMKEAGVKGWDDPATVRAYGKQMEQGYMKMVADYARTDSPLRPVQPNYNMEHIKKMMLEWQETGVKAGTAGQAKYADPALVEKFIKMKEEGTLPEIQNYEGAGNAPIPGINTEASLVKATQAQIDKVRALRDRMESKGKPPGLQGKAGKALTKRKAEKASRR